MERPEAAATLGNSGAYESKSNSRLREDEEPIKVKHLRFLPLFFKYAF